MTSFGVVGGGRGGKVLQENVGWKWDQTRADKAAAEGVFISIHKRPTKAQGFRNFNPGKSWVRTNKPATAKRGPQVSSASDIFISSVRARNAQGKVADINVRVAGSLNDVVEWYRGYAAGLLQSGVQVSPDPLGEDGVAFSAENTWGPAYYAALLTRERAAAQDQRPVQLTAEMQAQAQASRFERAKQLYLQDKQKRAAKKQAGIAEGKYSSEQAKKYTLDALDSIVQALVQAQKIRGDKLLVVGAKTEKGPTSLIEAVKRTMLVPETHFVDISEVYGDAAHYKKINKVMEAKKVKKTRALGKKKGGGDVNVLDQKYVIVPAVVDNIRILFASKAHDNLDSKRFIAVFEALTAAGRNVQADMGVLQAIAQRESSPAGFSGAQQFYAPPQAQAPLQGGALGAAVGPFSPPPPPRQ